MTKTTEKTNTSFILQVAVYTMLEELSGSRAESDKHKAGDNILHKIIPSLYLSVWLKLTNSTIRTFEAFLSSQKI